RQARAFVGFTVAVGVVEDIAGDAGKLHDVSALDHEAVRLEVIGVSEGGTEISRDRSAGVGADRQPRDGEGSRAGIADRTERNIGFRWLKDAAVCDRGIEFAEHSRDLEIRGADEGIELKLW